MTLPSSFLKPHWFLLFLFSISTSNISQRQRFVLEGWVLLGPTRLLKGQITWFFKHKQHKKLTWAHIYKRRHVHTFALTLTSAIRNMQESSKIQFQFVETYIAVFGPVFDVSFPPFHCFPFDRQLKRLKRRPKYFIFWWTLPKVMPWPHFKKFVMCLPKKYNYVIILLNSFCIFSLSHK